MVTTVNFEYIGLLRTKFFIQYTVSHIRYVMIFQWILTIRANVSDKKLYPRSDIPVHNRVLPNKCRALSQVCSIQEFNIVCLGDLILSIRWITEVHNRASLFFRRASGISDPQYPSSVATASLVTLATRLYAGKMHELCYFLPPVVSNFGGSVESSRQFSLSISARFCPNRVRLSILH